MTLSDFAQGLLSPFPSTEVPVSGCFLVFTECAHTSCSLGAQRAGSGSLPWALHVPGIYSQACQKRSAGASDRHSQAKSILLSKAQPRHGRG